MREQPNSPADDRKQAPRKARGDEIEDDEQAIDPDVRNEVGDETTPGLAPQLNQLLSPLTLERDFADGAINRLWQHSELLGNGDELLARQITIGALTFDGAPQNRIGFLTA